MASSKPADKKPTTIADVPCIKIGVIIRDTQMLQQMVQDPSLRQACQEDTDTVCQETVVAQEVAIVYNHLAAIFRAPVKPDVTAPATTTPSAEPVDKLVSQRDAALARVAELEAKLADIIPSAPTHEPCVGRDEACLETPEERKPGMARWTLSGQYDFYFTIDLPADIDLRDCKSIHTRHSRCYVWVDDETCHDCTMTRTIDIDKVHYDEDGRTDLKIDEYQEWEMADWSHGDSRVPVVTAPAATTPSAEPVDAPARPAKKAKVRPHTVH
eukprot:SAG25_NODE_465_length_7765_cov_162.049048_1_plen_270_part_00